MARRFSVALGSKIFRNQLQNSYLNTCENAKLVHLMMLREKKKKSLSTNATLTESSITVCLWSAKNNNKREKILNKSEQVKE